MSVCILHLSRHTLPPYMLRFFQILLTEGQQSDSCFAIYRFYTKCGMDLDIPGLLVDNTTPEERRVIARWTQDALTHSTGWSSSEPYQTLPAPRKMSVSVINSCASFSFLAVSMVVAVESALVVDAARTISGQHTERACCSYF